MTNLFDLSAGMAGTKMLTDRAHRDGSPLHRDRQDVKRTADQAKVHVEDKLLQGASNRSSSGNKSNASPMKMLLAKEMSTEVESKRKTPSVVAKLMGLEDILPTQQPVLCSAKRDLKKSHSHNSFAATNRAVQQQEQHHSSKTMPRDIHIAPNETVEYKDVYEVCKEPSRTPHLQDQILLRWRSSENKSDRRMEVVREKFMEAKRLATDEKLLHSNEFQEALEVLSSNRDLFLKFLEEPNSIFSKQPTGLCKIPVPPQTKRITVLKPIKSVENKGIRETRTQQVDQDGFETGKTHQRSYPNKETFSQPTRIVVLKPSPGKPSRTKARLVPQAAPSELIEQNDFYGGLEDDEARLGSREVLHGSIQHLREGWHRRDESLLSSVYSNGYGGDESSFSRSEIDYIDEEGGSFSDSGVVSPVSRHSWDYVKRYGSPYPGLSFSRTSHSPESSVIREAKKRLSERWAMVACDDINQEQVQLPRSSSTLGEMLSLREVKKEEFVAGIHPVLSSRSCGTENELTMQATLISTHKEDDENGESSPRNLPRSKSVPVSSSKFDNIVVNDHASSSEGCKTTGVVTRSSKGKSSFKGKVSSFFFSRSKKLTKEKITHLCDSSEERTEVTCLGGTGSEGDHNLETDEKVTFCEDKADNSTMQATKDIASTEALISSDCPIANLDGLRSNGGLKGIRDQPSPTSVLDAPFEDSNGNEPESSRSTNSSNEGVALRSSSIESVACSLSWEDANLQSHLLGSPKLFTLISNVDDDELGCHALVQKIISSSGLDSAQLGVVFDGWYLPDCPLDPALCDTFLDRKEEAAKSRERRANQRLLFDTVNMALIEIAQNALLSSCPWSKARCGAWRETLSRSLGEEVWSLVRSWLYGSGNFVASENDNAGTMMERIVKDEVEGRGWVKSMRLEADEITKEIEGGVLEELVREAVVDLAIWFSQ